LIAMKICPSRQQRIRWTAITTALLLITPVLQLKGAQEQKSHTARRTRHHRSYHHYTRYTHVKIKPERVKEIQQALVDAGTLHETPNGLWDQATRDAMKEFQKQNGFTPTGLPEAKPLMKLGLGPHPLPPGLGPQPEIQTEAETARGPETAANPVSPALKKPTTSN
jgi:peptidoglycan hydrolase-like protein with peptidoglycan-binding domain